MGGYHGTDVASAEQIIQHGFRVDSDAVFFAPLDNLKFAQTHGERRARDRGDTSYAVIQAIFPGKMLEFGLKGDQVKIPLAEIGTISIIGLQIYDFEQARLILRKTRDELQHMRAME